MGEVVSIDVWVAGRNGGVARGRREGTTRAASWHPSLGTNDDGGVQPALLGLEEPIDRLERAVERIDRVTARVHARGGRLAPDVETELLALVGQVSLGLVSDAAGRAERLAEVLGGAASSGR